MALPTNSFRSRRYFRSKFRESKYLLAAEATDLQLESFEQLREYIKNTFGDISVGPAFRADLSAANKLVIRPGEAWNDGIPFILKSGSDALVNAGILPTNVTLADKNAGVSDIGGKEITFAPTAANGAYSVIIEAVEEIVKEAGSSGAVDQFLAGVNVSEGTEHKFRIIYKINIVKTSDLASPTFPLVSGTNHLVNEISLIPSGTENFIISATDITPDINGADRSVLFNNSLAQIPFSTDANDYIFGKLVDSDGNIFTITSITTSTGGTTVQFLLDREVGVGSPNPKSGLPKITVAVPFKLIKRDLYVTDSNGNPLGKRYMRVADFTFTTPNILSLVDTRTISEVNTFGSDPNVRLRDGGLLSWNATLSTLSNSGNIKVTVPGILGNALIAPGSIILPLDGDVAYIYLNRTASSDYIVVPTVTAKSNVPSDVDVYIIAERGNLRVHFPHNGSIGDGETGFLGGFGSELAKDLSRDNITDMLTEVQMDEVFAETFDDSTDVDLVNSTSMTFEVFNKLFRAGSSARFVDYLGDTIPESDPFDPWTKLGTQAATVLGGILTLSDISVADRVNYFRTESSLVPLVHAEIKSRMRLNAPVSTGANPFVLSMKDGLGGKSFGLRVTETITSLVDGSGATLQSVANVGTLYHEYKLVKVGNLSVQWYIDGVMQGAYKYSDISTLSGGSSELAFGSDNASTVNAGIDFVKYKIYQSILQSVDLFRETSVFYEGDALPESSTPVWTKIGGVGITVTALNGKLSIIDASGGNGLSYTRVESSLTRHGDTEVEMRVNIASAGRASFDKFGVRLLDGAKDIAVYVRDLAGQLKVGLYDAGLGTLVGSEFNIDSDAFAVIKLRKTRDEFVDLLIDNQLKTTHGYEEFTSSTSTKEIRFGSFNALSQYSAVIDFVQYGLPGAGSLAATPVSSFMATVTTSDPSPIVWVSTDNGITWYEGIPSNTTSITDLDTTGANLLIRIGLSTINATIDDYGLYYNKTGFEVDGPFRYAEIIAIAGQTTFPLPFVYTPGVNELIVIYKPLAGSGRELFLVEDYIEPDSNHVVLSFPANAGDKVKFRVIFVKDPVVVPIGGAFIGHDHDGSDGEASNLNPNDITMTGNLIVAGTINGMSPLELSSDNTGVIVGDGLLNSLGVDLDLKVQVAGNSEPRLVLARGASSWEIKNSQPDDSMYFTKADVQKMKVDSLGALTVPSITVGNLTVTGTHNISAGGGGTAGREISYITITRDTLVTPSAVSDGDVVYICSGSAPTWDIGIAPGSSVGQVVSFIIKFGVAGLSIRFTDNTIVVPGSGIIRINNDPQRTLTTNQQAAQFMWDGLTWTELAGRH